ncbi:MAG: CRTAC1 family protein, partial [Bacteroidota bacterium]
GQAGRNELFINDGTGRFSEQAEAFGLDFAGYSTQAYFFDYDGDHDLDLYLLNHSTHTERTLGRAFLRDQPHPTAGDRLFRNDDGQFTDVTLDAGLYSGSIGYGLSASVTDLDGNGCTDLYVANDFHENDYVYLNQCDGTFRESVRESMPHTSQFSMGTDAGDVNGDGRMDLVVLDMLPEDELTRQTSETAEAYDIYQLKRRFGYHHQHGRNTLQLNAGLNASGVPAFQDAAYLAGLEATDWSWGALFGDYDLDGRQDVFITNGILRRPNDLDYLNFHSNAAVQASLQADERGNDLELVEKMPSVPVPNYAFRNEGRLGMANVSATWGLDHVGFSTGVAHGDLDGDGDLDLIVSHVNEPVSLYQNTAVENGARPALHLTLEGPAGNPYGLGTRVTLVADSASTAFDVYPTRGWLSSSEPAVITGTASDSVDVRVVWPGGETQEQRISGSGRTSLAYEPTGRTRPIDVRPDPDLAGELGLEFTHIENTFVDFNRELLMPEKVSMEGPALAVGDVDGDGLDDVFIGGAKYQAGALFVQQADGAFAVSEQPALVADSLHEDVDALWFDADGDLDVDLYVVSAGNEFWGQNAGLADRFYRNEDGLLVRDRAALPEWYENGGAVAAGDADGDGDLDLFVGGRVKARAYGEWPQSILLVNNGSGVFVDETSTRAP